MPVISVLLFAVVSVSSVLFAVVYVISVLLFAVVPLWFSVLWMIPIISEIRKKCGSTGPTFSSPIVSLTLCPLLSFRPVYSFPSRK
jgi:uncharacterized membrane protein